MTRALKDTDIDLCILCSVLIRIVLAASIKTERVIGIALRVCSVDRCS